MALKKRNNSVGETTRPIGIDRMVLARISSALGALGIIVAALAFIIQRDITPILLISTLIGVGGIALWTVLAPDDLRGMLTGRRLMYGGNSIFSTILLIGIVAIAYALTFNSGIAADFTQVGYYSLKEDTKSIMQSLERPIQITAFYSRDLLSNRDSDMPVLQMFADAAPDKVKLVVADPDEQLLLAKKLGLLGSTGIFVSFLDNNGEPDPQYTVQSVGSYARENWISQGILQLQARGKYRILFTTGHGEMDTDIQNKGDAYAIRNGAESVGIQTGTLDLKNQEIPDGTSAIIVIRPQIDFDQSETDKIAKYMAAGGKLLIMAKPAYTSTFQFMTTPDSPMFKYLADNWGVRPDNDIVFDPTSHVDDPYRVLAFKVSGTGIMGRDASNTSPIRPMLTLAQSWDFANTPPANVQSIKLIVTSPQAVGKRNLPKVAANPNDAANLKQEEGDLVGELTLAAALENTKTNARLIVIGDADWVYNDLVIQYDGQYLWTNMVDWLTRYLSKITVQPKIKTLPLIADTASLSVVVLISLVILPGLVLVMGALVWWNRLRQQ